MAGNIRYLVLSKGGFTMKKQALLTAALCLWSLVSAQTPYGELPERFRPDTLPCRLSGDVCFAIEGLGEVAFRSRGLAGCRDPRVAFIAGDTLVTFMPVAGFADTKQRDPVCRFYGGNVAHVLSRTHKVTVRCLLSAFQGRLAGVFTVLNGRKNYSGALTIFTLETLPRGSCSTATHSLL